MKGYAGALIVLIILITFVVLFFPLAPNVSSTSSVTGNNASLEIWDITDPEGGSYKVYADGSPQGGGPNATTTAEFFANFTNLTSGESINGSGVECNISFNETGNWSTNSMSFNSTSKIYEYSKTFDSRGFYFWNVTCDGFSQDYEILNTTDNMSVTNTPAGIYVPLGSINCSEDTVCLYNFSEKCYDIDDIDENNLTYGYKAGTEFTGFSMDANGNVTVDITTDSDCGDFFVTLLDKDAVGEGATADKEFIVNAVNDKPTLSGVPSSSYQNSSFYADIDASDEESNTFYFNTTFISCYRPFNAQHSNVTNCSGLFSIDNQSGIINRTTVFENFDVGNYSINFTATDPGDNLTGTSIPPYIWLPNATGYQVVNFMVIDINDRPVIDSVQNQFWTQNESVTLVINASDIDNGTLVFNTTALYRNLSVFYHNTSLFPVTVNQTVYLDNGTSLGNVTLNYTVSPNQVGNYTVNISVYDGRVNGTAWTVFNVTIANINDPPNISFNCKNYSVEGLEYYCDIEENTTDPDDFPAYVPYVDPVNGTLTFYLNFTNCSKVNQSDTNCSIFGINDQTGVINYTNPLKKDAGNYTLNISVTDGGNLTDWAEFNLTLIADYQPNIITSVPAQTAWQNQSFYLEINATDLDNATADNITFRTETYYNSVLLNNTLFPIDTDTTFWVSENITMGIMNYTSVNNSQVGNYSIKIIVNDTWGRENSILVDFTVWNLNDPPVLNFSCANSTNEDIEYICNVGENTTDLDMQTPDNDTLTYNLTIISGFNFFGINSTTGVLNFTPSNDSWANNTYNLTYLMNISVTDSNGSIDWTEFNLTINAVNDPPVFNFSNRTAWENVTFLMNLSVNATDEEGNTPFYYNLTFLNCSKINVNDTNCSIFTVNETTGVVNFTPVYNDIGNYTINTTVRDSGNTTSPYNSTGWQVINFTVNMLNMPPSLDVWFTDPTNRSLVENDSITFFITVSDPNGDPLTCRWYKNGVLNRTISDCHGSGGQAGSITYKSSFEDSGINNGTHNFTLRITDGIYTTLDWWDVNVTNKNRPPVLFVDILTPQTWPMNIPHQIYPNLSYYMRDPDNENNVSDDDTALTYSFTREPSSISVSINQNTTQATLTPAPDWYGVDYIIFTFNDSEFEISSNNITLNVTYVETETQTIVQHTTSGTATVVTRIASLTITVISPVQVKSNTKTVVPVNFKNTGDVTLNDINIVTETSEKDDFSLSVDPAKISVLETYKNATAELTIDAYNLTKDRYEIKIIGKVGSPKFNQSTVIYLENIFENRTKLEERIELVKDLFEENPECLDLTELIVQAERELGKGDIGKARDLTETALQNCRDLIRYSANMTQSVVPGIRERVPAIEILIGVIVVGLLALGAYYVIRRRTERKVRRKREKETVIIRT
ncbi:MAG: hypothetical protein GTN76_07910 [Candidatus Aenigmarchaeota archaeon]|nr:hypothetical protein [Candidatus Aenigmarchaeota archaeon]